MRETQVQSLGQEDPLEKEIATHSSILAWKIARMEGRSRLHPWGHKELDMTEQLHFHLQSSLPTSIYWIDCLFSIEYSWLHCQIFSSVAQSCLTLCHPVDCSMPGLPVHHQLPDFTQTHVHWVGDAIQSSHPLSSPSPPAFNLSLASGSFPVSQFFASSGQSIGVSASTLSNISWPYMIYDVGPVLVTYGLYYGELCSFCAYLLDICWIPFHWILCLFLMPLPHSFKALCSTIYFIKL